MHSNRSLPFLLAAVLAVAGFAFADNLRDVLAGIRAPALAARIRYLSDDLLRGRAPGSRGGRLAALYLATEFEAAGLRPAAAHFLQTVPLVGARPDPERTGLSFRFADAAPITAVYGEDAVLWAPTADTLTQVEGELVFAGYGIRAPEFDWDDFEDRDLRGRILLVLVGDPPAPPEEPGLFDGRAMTLYGRWSYKLEEPDAGAPPACSWSTIRSMQATIGRWCGVPGRGNSFLCRVMARFRFRSPAGSTRS